MSAFTFDIVKSAVLDAGFEIFRAKGDTIQLAERVRSHLMDASVSVRITDSATTSFIVRTQRADFPGATPDELFDKVRAAISDGAKQHGFAETATSSRELRDPGDNTRVLDLWHELTYGKQASDIAGLLSDLHWALSQSKCIAP